MERDRHKQREKQQQQQKQIREEMKNRNESNTYQSEAKLRELSNLTNTNLTN